MFFHRVTRNKWETHPNRNINTIETNIKQFLQPNVATNRVIVSRIQKMAFIVYFYCKREMNETSGKKVSIWLIRRPFARPVCNHWRYDSLPYWSSINKILTQTHNLKLVAIFNDIPMAFITAIRHRKHMSRKAETFTVITELYVHTASAEREREDLENETLSSSISNFICWHSTVYESDNARTHNTQVCVNLRLQNNRDWIARVLSVRLGREIFVPWIRDEVWREYDVTDRAMVRKPTRVGGMRKTN